MPDKAEKARRKEILHGQREEARRKVRESLPADALTLKALFDHIDSRLESTECDNTLGTRWISFRVAVLPKMSS
jgi:hypothetical protein